MLFGAKTIKDIKIQDLLLAGIGIKFRPTTDGNLTYLRGIKMNESGSPTNGILNRYSNLTGNNEYTAKPDPQSGTDTDTDTTNSISDETIAKNMFKVDDWVFLYAETNFIPHLDSDKYNFDKILEIIPHDTLLGFRLAIEYHANNYAVFEKFQPIAIMHYCLANDASDDESETIKTIREHISKDLTDDKKNSIHTLLNTLTSGCKSPEKYPYDAYNDSLITLDSSHADCNNDIIEFDKHAYSLILDAKKNEESFLQLLTSLANEDSSDKEKVKTLKQITNSSNFTEALIQLNELRRKDFSDSIASVHSQTKIIP
nr:hypothetical protein [Endozoicomonas sp.]